jgi:hypothetical protein
MTRETGLSPRRAPKLSRLPLSPRRTQVRLRPLLFLRPHAPKGGTRTSETPRFGSLQTALFLTLACARCPACSQDSSWSHGAARSARVPSCGLNRLRPGLAGSPRFKSSDPSRAKPSRLLHPGPFCAVSTGKLEFPVWREKLQCKPIFLSKPESKRFLERNTRWPTEAVTPATTNK